MKITQDVRDYAAEHGFYGDETVLETGMQEMADVFKEKGGELYL